MDRFQSACKKDHNTDAARVRVHNYKISVVDKGYGVCLVLQDLLATFDTVDHDIPCTFLEDFIGLEGPALNFLKLILLVEQMCLCKRSSD